MEMVPKESSSSRRITMNEPNPVPSLEQFPRIPVQGNITVAESHSELHSLPSTPSDPTTGRGFSPAIANYTAASKDEITSRLPFKIPSIRMSANKPRASLIMSKQEGVAKAVWDAWREEGVKGVYDCLSQVDGSSGIGNITGFVVKMVTSVTAGWVKLCEAPSTLIAMWFPHLEWKTVDINDTFSNVRGWKESWIRVFEWHPNYSLAAIALNDDSVRLWRVNRNDVPMLRCQEQINVSCISWRPIITNELAVGCEDCIIIWYLTSSTSMAKDKTDVLRVSGHGPVNCVEYSPNGLHLLSSSAKDSSVYMWDTYMFNSHPLKRVSGGGISLTLYSPKGNRFLAASPTSTFWIWEIRNTWKCCRWNTPKTMIEAACWNPEGSILLFATNGMIYGVFFELSPVDRFVAQTDAIVKPIYDIQECHMLDDEENLAYKVGGKARHMEWDSSGHRVAVMFDDSEMVAVFRVVPQSRSELLAPLGFIRGHPDEYPLVITFQKNFPEGALLTIAWSTGRIQYFPMIFALPTTDRNMLHEDHYRTQNIIHGRPVQFAAAGFVSPRISVAGVEPSTSNVSELFNEQREATSPSRLYSVSRRSD